MGKPAHPRPLSESQARAVGRNIRVSPRKLNLVAQSIRGKSAESALTTLTFTHKRIAQDVKKILQSAIANAENNHDLDVDDLIVSEASVGKNMTMKRFRARARGRAARIEKPFSQITIVVEEKSALQPAKGKGATKPAAKKAAPVESTAAEEPAETKDAEAKSEAKKAPAKKAPAKKAPAKKAAAKKETAEKATAKSKSSAKPKASKSKSGTEKPAKGKETK